MAPPETTWTQMIQRHRVTIARVILLLLAIYIFGFERQPVQALSSAMGLIGIVLITLGVIIRSVSAGNLHKNDVLATSGIYAIVRNPLYFGSLMMLMGVNFIIFHPVVVIVSAVLFVLTYWPTIRNEESGLKQRYGTEWTDYRNSTPRLLPNVFKIAHLKTATWSARQWYRNHEHNTVIAALALLILLHVYNLYWAL